MVTSVPCMLPCYNTPGFFCSPRIVMAGDFLGHWRSFLWFILPCHVEELLHCPQLSWLVPRRFFCHASEWILRRNIYVYVYLSSCRLPLREYRRADARERKYNGGSICTFIYVDPFRCRDEWGWACVRNDMCRAYVKILLVCTFPTSF